MSRRSSFTKWRAQIDDQGADYTIRTVDSLEDGVQWIRETTPAGEAKAVVQRLMWDGDRYEPYTPAEPLLDTFEFEHDGSQWRPTRRLAWGQGWSVPWTATAAWGCRAIDYSTSIDIVHDRVDWIGCQDERDRLREKLMLHLPVPEMESRLCALSMEIDAAQDVWDGDGLKVVARRAGGYFYVAAWLS